MNIALGNLSGPRPDAGTIVSGRGAGASGLGTVVAPLSDLRIQTVTGPPRPVDHSVWLCA
jgi:hypothetical protein